MPIGTYKYNLIKDLFTSYIDDEDILICTLCGEILRIMSQHFEIEHNEWTSAIWIKDTGFLEENRAYRNRNLGDYILNPNIEVRRTEIYPYYCKLCQKPINSYSALRSHFKKVHNQKVKFYKTHLDPSKNEDSLFCSPKLSEISKIDCVNEERK